MCFRCCRHCVNPSLTLECDEVEGGETRGVHDDEIDLWVKQEASDKGLDLMVSMQDSDTDVSVYVKEGKTDGELESLMMFSKGVPNAIPKAGFQGKNIEAVVLLIEGKIEINNISKLITKMNLPGGDQLKRSGI